MRNWFFTPPLTLALLGAACSSADDVAPETPARPVTVLELRSEIPRGELLATGVVEPYRSSDIGFEVGGRILGMVDPGQELAGPLLDADGQLLLDGDGNPRREGDVVAVLDDTRYRQAVEATRLKLESTRKQLAAQQVDLDELASAQLEGAKAQSQAAAAEVAAAREDISSAEAALELARTTAERNRTLAETGAVSRSVVDESEAQLTTSQAKLEQARRRVDSMLQAQRAADADVAAAEGSILLKKANLETTEAQIKELENELQRARTDLESCVLRAPFSGRLVSAAVASGTFVQPGQPVGTLVMMAPVKVVFTASAGQDRQLSLGMGVRVYPDQGTPDLLEEGIVGTVYEKGEVADPGTRTFRVGILVRNPLLNGDIDGDVAAPGTGIFPAIARTMDADAPLWVNMDCVFEEGNQAYVLHLPELRLTQVERDLEAAYRPERVAVTLADEWDQIDRWSLRRLGDAGGLVQGDALVMNPDPTAQDELVHLAGRQWALRPGDLVRIGLDLDRPPKGIWVPVSAISERNGSTSVARLDDERIELLEVQVHEAYQELRRVEAEGLGEGSRIVSRGVHYVSDGERVRVVGTEGR